MNDLDELLALVRRTHRDRCPVYGHWHAYGNQTEENRPVRYADPRTIRIDCHDQCTNPDCTRYKRCTHEWHDFDELLARLLTTKAGL